MKALILAAGLGTRLRPFTTDLPKALAPVAGRPMIDHAIEKMYNYGVKDIVINLHHHGELLRKYIESKIYYNVNIYFSDESDKLLDTGGAIKKAEPFLKGKEPFFVHNVDVLSDINLKKLYEHHLRKENLVTLAVRKRTTSRYLLFDEYYNLCGWKNTNTGEEKIVKDYGNTLLLLAFSGIQIVSQEIFDLCPEVDKFSAVDLYLNAVKTNNIGAYVHDKDYWFDLGTIDKIKEAEMYLNLHGAK